MAALYGLILLAESELSFLILALPAAIIFGRQITLARVQVMLICHSRTNINCISCQIHLPKLTFHFLSVTFYNASDVDVPKQ